MMSASLFLALIGRADATEGMWRPSQLESLQGELTELGVDPAAVSAVVPNSLNATVALSRCSGAFVSPTGLVATSYHCVTSGLEFASNKGENLFETGFQARTQAEERWLGPSEYVRLTVGTENVTEAVLAGTKKLSGPQRAEKLASNQEKIVATCEAGGGLTCEVVAYDHGVEYELRKMKDFRDVRLVYAPPRAVGYFGGNDDNWQWPRHSGDFAFLRVYAENGHSSGYTATHTPYAPSAYLPPAKTGPVPGEFVMVTGFPAYTFRWLTAAELDLAEQVEYPVKLALAKDTLEALDKLEKTPEIAVKIGARKMSVSNNITYWTGGREGLEKNQLAEERWKLERELEAWVAADPTRTQKWGPSLIALRSAHTALQENARARMILEDTIGQVDLLNAAITLYTLAEESRKPDKQRAEGFHNRDLPQIQGLLDEADATFDWRIDRDILRIYLLALMQTTDCSVGRDVVSWVESKTEGPSQHDRVEQILELLYQDVQLSDPLIRRSLMETSPWFLTKSGNPWFELAAVMHPNLSAARSKRAALEAERDGARAGYMEALRVFFPVARPRAVGADQTLTPGLFYSDANDTLRISLGKVDGYFPADGLIAAPVTRLEGIVAKNGAYPFDSPPSLLAAVEARRVGGYLDASLGSVPVNFLTTLDTARGSSGSPTLNAKGEFVGIIFDGNDQSMAADWVFDPRVTRSIHTDIGYILWYLDAVAGAAPLLRELGREPEFTAIHAAEGQDGSALAK